MISRRNFIASGTAFGSSLLMNKISFGALTAAGVGKRTFPLGSAAVKQFILTANRFSTPRHTTSYWEVGPKDGALIIFLHGWPEIGLMWRGQMEALAADGWRCIAPDMRGYGGSSAPTSTDAYALKEIVADMIELHDHLGGKPAIWIGHDLGSPVAGALTALYPAKSRGVVFVSVPYLPETFALPTLLPLIDRQLYPADKYPFGQYDYFHFYLTHFEQACGDFNADIPGSLAAIYRSGNPASVGQIYRSAMITANGGWFGSAHRAPVVQPDTALWPPADFDALVAAFRTTGFRPGNAWYLNDSANMIYASTAADRGSLQQPVLFVNGQFDSICDINRSRIGEPMRDACHDLTVVNQPAGHWLPLERKAELTEAIRSWIRSKAL
jgi:pimeloyl-ACP methyl ester carboxylesterase